MKKLYLLMILSMIILSACFAEPIDSVEQTSENSSSSPSELAETSSNESTSSDYVIPTGVDNVDTAFNKIISTSRKRGTDGEYSTMEYLKSQLELLGYTTDVQKFPVYRNEIDVFESDFSELNPFNEEPLTTAHNLIAEKDFDPAKKTIVFSAHYDTNTDSIGAVDNGSGTTVLLETAKLIAPYIKDLDYNVRIIFFSSEEYYLTGSRTYLENLSDTQLEDIVACFNIDLTSTSVWRNLLLSGYESKFSEEFLRLNPEFTLGYHGASDDISFMEKDIMAFRMHTVDRSAEGFDPRTILSEETENNYVDTDLIKTDAEIVYNFMKKLDIDNLF